jgi:L-iditol 2-dehydrogenase
MPVLNPGEALLKVESCAICGSDIRTLKHGNPRVSPGQIVGHEIAGTICEISGRQNKWNIGDRLSIGADVPCGQCLYCKSGQSNCCDVNYAIGHQFEGGFTEYMLLNSLTLERGPIKKLKDDTMFDAAALAEPLACCINGYECGLMRQCRSVVIFGAGPIGIMLGMLAFAYDAPLVLLIDPNESRLEMAMSTGAATHTLNPSGHDVKAYVDQLTSGMGADLIFTACPVVETHEQAVSIVSRRGVINLFGGLPAGARQINIKSNDLHYREAYLTGSHGSTPGQHAKAVDLIESGKINVNLLITHRFPLSSILKAYEVAESGKAIKIIIHPHNEGSSQDV